MSTKANSAIAHTMLSERTERIAALTRNRGVPVLIGAGVTMDAGGPGGESLGKDIFAYLYPEALAEGSAPKTFEDIMASLPAGQEVRAELVAERLRGLEPSVTLIQLAELIRDGILAPLVVTPNFDDLAERALKAVGVTNIRLIVGDDVTTRTSLIDESAVTVLKVHGDLSRPLSMRLDPVALEQLPDPLVDSLAETVEAHGLIVVGYALRDPGLFQALSRASTKAVAAWVGIGPMTPPVERFLAVHGATENALGEGVESFVNILRDQSLSRAIYRTFDQRIECAWEQLDQARGRDCDRDRFRRLSEAFEGEDGALLAEVQALRLLASFDFSDQGDTRAFREGIRLLKDTFARRRALLPGARTRIAARYMQELTRAIFHGVDEDFTVSTGIGLAEVEAVVASVRDDVEAYSQRAGVSVCDRAACLVYASEALKELQQRTPTGDSTRLDAARQCAAEAMNLLPAAPPQVAPESWVRGVYLSGVAGRHLGVIHEYLASLPATSAPDRLTHVKQMAAQSRQAADSLATIGEKAVCGYAEMNWCLAETRLFRRQDHDWHELITEFERLSEGYLTAEAHFRAVGDRRGLAWVNAHLAGLCETFLELMGDRVIENENAYVLQIADDMYRYAMIGRTWSQRVMGDSMAFGLTSVLAASALVAVSRRGVGREGEIDTQLQRAIRLAEEGISHLSGTRRAQNAAIGNMVKADALLMLAERSEHDASVRCRADAITALADALALLIRSGTMEIAEFESEYDAFTGVLDRIRARFSLTI